ncbi:MAG: ABC transporter substrate-binding protein [Euryarchaeota archaeon]|nr:ABC transporter substrate-binding protein [Euryarchaeota archaeon]
MLCSITCIAGCIDIFTLENVNNTKPVYRVGVTSEEPPITYVDTDGTWRGIDVESIQWIGEEMGFEVVLVPLIWKNWLPMLESKKIDIVYSSMTITPERAELINFSNPYMVADQCITSHIDSHLTMADFLEGKGKIGVMKGGTGEEWVVQNQIESGVRLSSQIVQYDSISLAFLDLVGKKIDFVIHDTHATRDGIVNTPLSVIGTVETNEKYGVGMRKDDVELLQTINEGLRRLMASPKWPELLEKYQFTS